RLLIAGLLAVICIVVGHATRANATSITFQVTGTLIGFDGPVLAPLAVGQAYTATYTFDSNAAGTPVFGGGVDYIGAITAATFSIGSYNGKLGSPINTTIRVLDDFFGFQDQYLAVIGDITFGGPFGVIDAP